MPSRRRPQQKIEQIGAAVSIVPRSHSQNGKGTRTPSNHGIPGVNADVERTGSYFGGNRQRDIVDILGAKMAEGQSGQCHGLWALLRLGVGHGARSIKRTGHV